MLGQTLSTAAPPFGTLGRLSRIDEPGIVMSVEKDSAFDPYHKWLGIPKGQRPPTFYRLLGIEPSEIDVEVIEEAAIRQITHLRAYQVGQHSALCTRLLNEISAA